MNPNPDMPEEIKEAVKRQTELQITLQALDMTNVYADIEAQISVNTRRVQALRELAEVTSIIQEYIDDGKKAPIARYWQNGTVRRG